MVALPRSSLHISPEQIKYGTANSSWLSSKVSHKRSFGMGCDAQNWAGLLVAANVYGYILPMFAYAKAHVAPSHAEDRKFSGEIRCQVLEMPLLTSDLGSWLYDFYMGIEFNPRFGNNWDFKLFHNGRPGIVAWTLM
jgi:hypothetical protein